MNHFKSLFYIIASIFAFSFICASAEEVVCENKEPKKEKWIQLFNGKDLTGWTPKIRYEKLGDDKRETFRVADGAIRSAMKITMSLIKRLATFFTKPLILVTDFV